MKSILVKFTALFCTLAAAVSSNWVADTIDYFVRRGAGLGTSNEDLFRCFYLLFGVAVFFAAAAWLFTNRERIFRTRLRFKTVDKKAKVLAIFLSPTPSTPVLTDGTWSIIKSKDDTYTFSGNLTEDVANLKFYWNWHPLLRGLIPHQETLERVYLINSSGGKNSSKSFGKPAAEFLGIFLGKVEILYEDYTVDFEDFQKVTDLLDRIILEEHRRGVREHDIVVDVTGGMKPSSIAGAVVTNTTDVVFQYVQTDPADGTEPKALFYDIIHHAPMDE